jgi:hypothetical protein
MFARESIAKVIFILQKNDTNMDPRTLVTFQSDAFNTSEPKDYFINECCFGDDLAAWIINELSSRQYETDATPGQEDFGWYLGFKVLGVRHFLVLGYREDTDGSGTWIGWVERNRLFFRKRGIEPEATQAIHEVLSNAPQINNVRWHCTQDFEASHEELGINHP